MKIQATHEYPASADAVVAMMHDPAWLADVAATAGAKAHDVSVDGDRIQLRASLATPATAQKLVGDQMAFSMTITWGTPDASGMRHGTLDVTMDGFPASMTGTGVMTPASATSTTVTYDATFDVNIPLVGGRIEQAAAPYVRQVIDTQQQVGLRYLEANS